MHQYINNNVQYHNCMHNLAGEMRHNHDAMVDEFDRLKAYFYDDYPPPPLPFE